MTQAIERSSLRECIVNIGAPKTGTTALQKFLYDNRDDLKTLGVLYPDVSLRGYGHHDLAFLIGGGYPEWATAQELPLSALLDRLAFCIKTGPEKIIICSENFFLLPNPGGLKKSLEQAGIVSDDRIRIVVYVRRQDDAHISWYNQIVKAQGYTGTIEDAVREYHGLWDYASRLAKWAAEFGEENLTVRTYEDLKEGDICLDFVHTMELPEILPSVRQEKINTRINRDILEFQRLINRLPLSPQEKRRFHKELIALTSATEGHGLFSVAPLLTKESRRKILKSYEQGNTQVARSFFRRDWLFDSSMPESEEYTEWEGPAHERIVYILGWILARARFG
jgi:hypothetical protein